MPLLFWKAICRVAHLHHEIGEPGALLADKMKHLKIWLLQPCDLRPPACISQWELENAAKDAKGRWCWFWSLRAQEEEVNGGGGGGDSPWMSHPKHLSTSHWDIYATILSPSSFSQASPHTSSHTHTHARTRARPRASPGDSNVTVSRHNLKLDEKQRWIELPPPPNWRVIGLKMCPWPPALWGWPSSRVTGARSKGTSKGRIGGAEEERRLPALRGLFVERRRARAAIKCIATPFSRGGFERVMHHPASVLCGLFVDGGG